MRRREFLTLGAGAAFATPVASTATPTAPGDARVDSLLRDYAAEDHRRRLAHIAKCTQSIRSCLRKHLITNYLPGQCCYNLGEYPARAPWTVDEYDEQELDRLQAHGIQVLQVFDDWNDSLRLFGADKYSAVNPEGYRRFIEMAHGRGMKVLTYTSTCFLQRSDPDFRPEWGRDGDFLVVGYWDMARCSPASPGWRAFVMQKIAQVLEEYGTDGIYIDGGYLANKHAAKRAMPAAKDEAAAFDESPEHDGAFADMLALIYAEVKRRGGIVKLHVNAAERPEAGGLKTYDYLWVGEGVANADALREAVKNYDPYVVPCLDMGFTRVEDEDEPYLHAVPYMQFPVTMGGRIFTGERGTIEGVKYNDDFWLQRCRDAWKQYRADPSSLYTYSAWDAVPGNPNTRPTHARWLARYRPLVEEGTWAWIEIGESTLFAAPPPKDVVVSAFANRELHLVVANYGRTPAEIITTTPFVDAHRGDGVASTQWTVPPRSLSILRHT
ncbi:MAG: hypothetical protein FJY92_02360, partial [Candidatus Hydrogenedentes bacterium]|nr:hypothetical protein [Candidatus Hydrogenedentota bacterium]